MPLEDLTGPNKYIGDLVREWPLGIDPFSEGDDHVRGLKNVLRNSFPTVAQDRYPVSFVLPPNGEAEEKAGAVELSVGTTAQRPAAPTVGQMRFNTETNRLEYWRDDEVWAALDPGRARGDIAALDAELSQRAVNIGAAGQVVMSDGQDVVYGSAGLGFSGLTVEEGTTSTDAIVKAGACNNFAGAKGAVLPADLEKSIASTWAQGNGQGGWLPGGSVSEGDSVHIILMTKDDDGAVDFGFDTDPFGANAPAGWTAHRRLKSLVAQSGGAMPLMTQFPGGNFSFHTARNKDLTGLATAPATSLVTLAQVPTGVPLRLYGVVYCNRTAGPEVGGGIYDWNMSNIDSIENMQARLTVSGSSTRVNAGHFEAWCDLSAQVRATIRSGTASVRTWVHGWYDPRGQA